MVSKTLSTKGLYKQCHLVADGIHSIHTQHNTTYTTQTHTSLTTIFRWISVSWWIPWSRH